VAINYFPTEEPDAHEVIALIQAAGRKGFASPAVCATRRSAGSSSAMLCQTSVVSTSSYAMRVG
jgi:hypothetical protein